jgi:cysteine desulfurase
MPLRFPIYMDHNASTPVDARVFEAMKPYFCDTFGNAASSGHSFGWASAQAVNHAAKQLAALLNCDRDEIIWTSGTTESNNLALKGIAESCRDRGRHIITQTTEHKSVIDPLKRLQDDGYEITWLQVARGGRIELDALRDSIRPDTILVSIMWVNNEIGTVQPIHEVGAICRERGVLFHTDATQAIGKLPVDVQAANVDLLSMTGHKIYGPKGSGALYIRAREPGIRICPLFDGGGHQNGVRSGTLNTPGIVGLGAACELAMSRMRDDAARWNLLRDRLENGIFAKLDGVSVNGDPQHRAPHVTNLGFAGVDGEMLLASMDDVAVSSGSACSSASREPSYVLRAIGVEWNLALSSIRFSLGRSTTEEEVDYTIAKFAGVVKGLRSFQFG